MANGLLEQFFLMWIPGNIYYSFLPSINGIESSAILRAIINPLSLILNIFAALSFLIIPILVKKFDDNKQYNFKIIKNIMIFYILLSVLFYLVIIFFNKDIFLILYGNKYLSFSNYLLIAGILPISASVVSLMGDALRALKKPNIIFKSYIFTLLSCFLVGIPLTLKYSIKGALLGMVISSITSAIFLTILFFKIYNKHNYVL